jgi:hypothetical protein
VSAAGTPHFGGGPPEEGRVKLPTNNAQKIEQTASLTVRSVAVIRHGGSRPIQRSAWKGYSQKFTSTSCETLRRAALSLGRPQRQPDEKDLHGDPHK